MNKIISENIIINTPKLPPDVEFIEQEIISKGFQPIRWSIVDVKDNQLTISVSGYKNN